MTGIKICGLFRACDIDYVNEAKPDYIGFILNYPKSHRSIDSKKAAEFRRALSPGIRAVGVFVDEDMETVCDAAKSIGLDVIQLHGSESGDYIRRIKARIGLPVWKAFKIKTAADLTDAKNSPADEILLDNGYGTGAAFDWSIIRSFERDYILAGGLTPENIPDALRLLSPRLIDISSGVETDRLKDRKKIFAAVRAVRNFAL